ncbi:aminotransferase class I/II-fold pyridoxal phosphate-dependent enzyme [Streptomyces sp. BK340]|uniref:aminotransferase class I/II-fold pyridoxal phosphate-dependent enzyme n=1 Tax=Streptomyces sp. BK340 TaxID=2572903 RepID=UPI0011A0EF47|nr:aminotransferase class I/II-fold pyridoxal phosphate-dependent enzyme [Streptomyces sp. BK340]TVZ84831.1 hypothetical protein FB157_12098 [Streptomyces sp. BK340]
MTGRLAAPAGSPVLEMARRAAERRAKGRNLVDLTLGEPDFAPPAHVIAAAQEAASRVLGYSPANGLPELRRAVRHAVERDRALECTDAQVAVGCAGCATVPGSAFGAPDHLRLSFATGIITLEEGCPTVVDVLDAVAS